MVVKVGIEKEAIGINATEIVERTGLRSIKVRNYMRIRIYFNTLLQEKDVIVGIDDNAGYPI